MAPLWLGDDRIATDLARRWPSRPRNFTGPGKGRTDIARVEHGF